MESRCCVSVIIPIYNVEEYLEECLDSIVAQSLGAMEVLLVDDGSTDNSSTIAQRYAGQFDHFKYFRKENGGLGSARNFGTDHAIGEYVAYCDSDDIIPPFAYEHMYALAKKCDCDIVSGDVDRFIGNKRYESSLHRIAFAKASERENIYQNPRLIFDTIAPNKLFRLEYLKTTGIRFPEDMLYEDIPTVIPLVCLTKKYAHLDEVVYSWRERDKTSEKSITQRRAEWKNFSDRLKALRMVDRFFEEKIDNAALVAEKNYKWLSLDLRMFINALPKADEDYRIAFMDTVVPYIQSIGLGALPKLEAVDRIKYYYLLNRDMKGLLKYFEFAKSSAAYKAIPLVKRNKRYYGKFPCSIPSEYADMTDEIIETGCSISVNKASLNEVEGLKLEGRVFYTRLNASKYDDIGIKAYLVTNEDNSIIGELPAAIVVDPNGKGELLRNIKRGYLRYVQRSQIKYGIDVDWTFLSSLKPGKYHIEAAYHCNDLYSERVFVAHPTNREKPFPFAVFAGQRFYTVDYDINHYLVVTVENVDRPIIDEIVLRDNRITLQESSTEIAVHTLENRNLNSLKNLVAEINGNNYLYRSHDEVISQFAGLAIRVYATKQGRLRLKEHESCAVSVDATFDDSLFTFLIDDFTEDDRPYDSKPILVGREHGAKISCHDYRRTQDGAILCRIDVSDNELASQLRADTYGLYLERGKFGDSNYHLIPVLSKRRLFSEARRCPGQKYEYSLATDGQEGFCVSTAWNAYENTRHRRNVMQKKIYRPIYKAARKLLPIDRKMVLFESYWGTQIGCSPAGMSQYLTRNHPDMHCAWLVNDERIPAEGKTTKIRKGTLPHYIAAARAHYLVSNVHFDDWLEKRTGQVLVQTTHGTPLKKVGLAAPNEFETEQAFERFAQDCARWDYLIASGPLTESILKENYRFKGRFLRTGLPRNDSLFERNDPDIVMKLRQQYGIPHDKKLILYAPTWRRRDQFDLKLDLTRMADEIGDEYIIGLRPHHLSTPGMNAAELDSRVINLASGPSAEDCYLMSDIVITDYSSLMFDVALLGKPMLFFVYDLEEYRDNMRGFNLDFEEEAPGPLLKTNDAVINAVKNIDAVERQYSSKYERFKNGYCGYEQGRASQQIYQQIMAPK